MPLSVLIATGTAAAASADTVLADGAQATLVLTGEGRAPVEVKISNGQYVRVAELTTTNAVQKIYGPAVFRVRRDLVLPTWVPNGLPEVTVPFGVEVYTDAALVQGLTRAQLDAAPVSTTDTTRDSTGQPFTPSACTHTYGYNANGLIVTDTATDGTSTWVKTYTYNASAQLTGETQWVKQ